MRAVDEDGLPHPVALLASVLLTGVLFLLALVWLTRRPQPIHLVHRPTMVRLVPLPAPLPQTPVPQKPSPQAAPAAPAPMLDIPLSPRSAVAVARKHPPVVRRFRPARASHDVQPRALAKSPDASAASAAPHAAPAMSVNDRGARDSLEGRIRQAIQAAYRYPEAARVMGDQGAVLVGFDYRDRILSSLRILESSTFPVLDRAALDIVRNAALPPPGALAGVTLSLEVKVVFHAVSEDE